MEKLSELLNHVEAALAELSDSKMQLEALEDLLSGFERSNRTTQRELDDLRKALQRETSACVSLRIAMIEAEVLGRRTALAWRRARVIACADMTDEERLLELELEALGWHDNTPKHEKEQLP